MKTIFRLIVLVLLLAGWALAAASLHVIRTPKTITVVPKDRLHWRDTYVDTRNWTLQDVTRHSGVARRLLQLDRAELLANVVDPKSGISVEAQLRDAIERGSRNATQPSQHASLTLENALSMLDISWGDSH